MCRNECRQHGHGRVELVDGTRLRGLRPVDGKTGGQRPGQRGEARARVVAENECRRGLELHRVRGDPHVAATEVAVALDRQSQSVLQQLRRGGQLDHGLRRRLVESAALDELSVELDVENPGEVVRRRG